MLHNTYLNRMHLDKVAVLVVVCKGLRFGFVGAPTADHVLGRVLCLP